MMRPAILLFVLLAGCGGQPEPVKLEAIAAVHDDLVQYATASCFAFQANGYLKDQGERWAGAIMQHARGPVEEWTPVADMVKAELSRSGVGKGQGEGPQSTTVPLPVMTCGRIAAAPAVRQSIAAAATALADDYRARQYR